MSRYSSDFKPTQSNPFKSIIKMKEVFKTTKCGQYKVSNLLNVKTVGYSLWVGSDLKEIASNKIPTRIGKTGKVECMIQVKGLGLKNTSVNNLAIQLFGEDEINKSIDYLNSLSDAK